MSHRHDSITTRRTRAVPLVGALIVFATFIAKDTIREQVKDTVDSIQQAEDVFAIRHEEQTILQAAMALYYGQHGDDDPLVIGAKLRAHPDYYYDRAMEQFFLTLPTWISSTALSRSSPNRNTTFGIRSRS